LNSIFDPDLTGTGHQPYGHDTYATLFGNYRVDKISYNILFTTPGSTNNALCTVSYGLSTTADTTGTGAAVPLEWPNAQHGNLSSSGDRSRILRGSIDLATLCGVTKTRYIGGDDFQATFGANPVVSPRLNVNVASYDGTSSQTVAVRVEIQYHCHLSNRLVLGQS
jgi:hypothetical protein